MVHPSVTAVLDPHLRHGGPTAAEAKARSSSDGGPRGAPRPFLHYRRRTTHKAPRKRTFVMYEMTRYTDLVLRPLPTSPASGLSASGGALIANSGGGSRNGGQRSAPEGAPAAAAAEGSLRLPAFTPDYSAAGSMTMGTGSSPADYVLAASGPGLEAHTHASAMQLLAGLVAQLSLLTRLLAFLVLLPTRALGGAGERLAGGLWKRWLHDASLHHDCRLASAATKAMLHMLGASSTSSSSASSLEQEGPVAADHAGAEQQATQSAAATDRLRALSMTAAAAAAALSHHPSAFGVAPVYGDMVHLLDPASPHHLVLALRGGRGEERRAQQQLQAAPAAAAAVAAPAAPQLSPRAVALARGQGPRPLDAPPLRAAAGASPAARAPAAPAVERGPEVDVVFVHGIGGEAFKTWRKPEAAKRDPSGRAPFAPDAIWPTAWLAEDFPQARLLSISYQAHLSAWQGDSQPLEAVARRALGQLLAAGVGQRPVVFVAHSMGGLLVKEVLRASLEAEAELQQQQREEGQQGAELAAASLPLARLARAARGAVFFATPHFGSGLAAAGWRLRHLLPLTRPSHALQRLTPGPHLVELNDALKALHEQRGLRVASVAEGLPTRIVPGLPGVTIVPPSSAHPGFGQQLVSPDQDHITVCKPTGRDSASYQAIQAMIGDVLAEQRASHAVRVPTPVPAGKVPEQEAEVAPAVVLAAVPAAPDATAAAPTAAVEDEGDDVALLPGSGSSSSSMLREQLARRAAMKALTEASLGLGRGRGTVSAPATPRGRRETGGRACAAEAHERVCWGSLAQQFRCCAVPAAA